MRISLLLMMLVSTLPALAAGEPVEYLAHYAQPGATHLRITIKVAEPLRAPQPFTFPRAIPMGYGECPGYSPR